MEDIKGYEAYEKNRKRLTELLSGSKCIFEDLNLNTRVKKIEDALEKVKSSVLKIMVMGEFKRGKSTFINALLGSEILPTDASPCTAVINEIKWGSKEDAVIYFKDPLPEHLPDNLPTGVKNYIGKAVGHSVPPLNIPIKNLKEYVAIPKDDDKESDTKYSPYKRAEIFWPYKLCKNGVEIVDSPGLNENEHREAVVNDYLPNADAIIFVFSCTKLITQTEIQQIENLYYMGFQNMLLVCNKIDLQRGRDRQKVMDYMCKRLDGYSDLGNKAVYFLSAKQALEGKLISNLELLQSSGIHDFEEFLAKFLINEKGRSKLLRPAIELKREISQTKNDIPRKLEALEQEVETIEMNAGKTMKLLREAEECREKISCILNERRKTIKESVTKAAVVHFLDVSEKSQRWIKEYEFLNKMCYLSDVEAKVKALFGEVIEEVKRRAEIEQAEWQAKVLRPMLKKYLTEINGSIEEHVKRIYSILSESRNELFPDGGGIDIKNGFEGGSVGAAEIIAKQAKLIDAGYTAGGIAATLGIAGVAIFVATTIVPLLPVYVAGGGVYVLLRAIGLNATKIEHGIKEWLDDRRFEMIVKKIKEHAMEQIPLEIKNTAGENAEKIAENVDKYVGNILISIESSINSEIDKVRDEVRNMLNIKRSGKDKVELHKLLLSTMKDKLTLIEKEADFLIELINMDC